MKYKLKDSYKGSYNRQFEKGEVIDSNDEFTGIVIEAPFTDTRFFEPVKVRKFVVEVSEDDMEIFEAYVCKQDDRWTVTEITESSSLVKLKENPAVSKEIIEVLSDINNLEKVIKAYAVAFATNAEQGKLAVIKYMKYWLVDNFPSISGLKDAKDIVDSWW